MTELKITRADRDAAKSLLGRDDAGPSWWAIDSGNADNDSMVQAFARHRIAAEEGKAELVLCLKRLEYWFDTDQEILDAMDHDTRADHDRQLAMIRAALARVRGEG